MVGVMFLNPDAVEAAAQSLQQMPAREGLTPTPWTEEPSEIQDLYRRDGRAAVEAAAREPVNTVNGQVTDGLREALESVLNLHECTNPDTPKFNRAVLDDLVDAVAAHSVERAGVSDTIETLAVPTRLANRNGLRVGELIEFLQKQDPEAPVAAKCGCGSRGWSAPATDAHVDSFTAVNSGACVKIGWGDFA